MEIFGLALRVVLQCLQDGCRDLIAHLQASAPRCETLVSFFAIWSDSFDIPLGDWVATPLTSLQFPEEAASLCGGSAGGGSGSSRPSSAPPAKSPKAGRRTPKELLLKNGPCHLGGVGSTSPLGEKNHSRTEIFDGRLRRAAAEKHSDVSLGFGQCVARLLPPESKDAEQHRRGSSVLQRFSAAMDASML